MINLNEEIDRLKNKFGILTKDFEISITRFFVSNYWFGETPTVDNGSVFVNEGFIKSQGGKIEEFCRYYGSDTLTKKNYLESKIESELPETYSIYQKYFAVHEHDNYIAYMILDFLLHNLPGEIRLSTDVEVASLVETAYDELPKVYGEVLTDLINWTRLNNIPKPVYRKVYFLPDYSTREESSAAYEQDYYFKILYYMFNASSIPSGHLQRI